ncbi:MAG: hypothetical protein WCQ41_10265, partial [Bacillota bacterium]
PPSGAGPSPASVPSTPSKLSIEIPCGGRPISTFCEELAANLSTFYTNWSRVTIQLHNANTYSGVNATSNKTNQGCLWCIKNGIVGRIVPTTGEPQRVSFKPFTAFEFVTAIEEHFTVYKTVMVAGRVTTVDTSITPIQAKVVLSSDILRSA